MSNEEKAKEIAEKNAIIYDAEEDTANELIYPTIHSTKECEKSALEMAAWKDAQFKQVMEKNIKENSKLRRRLAKMHARIETMKCCANCEHSKVTDKMAWKECYKNEGHACEKWVMIKE